MGDATLKADRQFRKDRTATDPAGDKGGDQAEVPAGLGAKAKVLEKGAVNALNRIIHQPFYKQFQNRFY